ncbi:MAG: bifunctional tetrahydrofolate synthase/dihydrofolate synthase [Gammaproteobacteria bacterium]|nr:bifunctional tetrahydrofolate synthase/dihydrofolate synthase [Gammaproteobacteria bacterium]
MRFKTLVEWLNWQESLHPQTIELGLERVSEVFQRLHSDPPPFKIITVAGTNGKGSTVALLESILRAAGYKTGAYTSPHLLEYNERISLNGAHASDEQICQAFDRIDQARGDTSLTYFEFGTLAALDIFYQAELDIAILEVGLGGRLDAVNIVDSDIAIITSIGLDHTDWLGDNRESIAREKAGIMRQNRPVICSEQDIPQTIYKEAERRGSELFCLGREFHYELYEEFWSWSGPEEESINLPFPIQTGAHQLRNASAVIMALNLLAESFPVRYEHIQQGLTSAQLAGRLQHLQDKQNWLVDVAHNTQSIEALAAHFKSDSTEKQVHAVVGMLKDKDIRSNLMTMQDVVTDWYCVELAGPRGASAEELKQVLQNFVPADTIQCFDNVPSAMQAVENRANSEDVRLVFGSFYTVAEALQRGV